MREELVTVVLHGRHKFAAYEVLEWRRVEHGLAPTIMFESFLEEGSYAIAVLERVRHSRRLAESLHIHLRQVVVTHLIYGQQALEARVHVAVETVVAQTNDALSDGSLNLLLAHLTSRLDMELALRGYFTDVRYFSFC